MRRILFVLAGVLAAGSAQIVAQKPVHPNFAGEWVIDPARSFSAPPPGAARGSGAGRGTGAPAPVPTASTPPGTGDPNAPVRVGGDVKPPRKIKDVAVAYPAEARAAQITGVVILDAVIGKDGAVKNVRVLKSVPGLDEAAVNAVSQWRYSPTLLNGEPVEVIMSVTTSFQLDPPGGSASAPGFGGRGASGAPAVTIKQNDKELRMTRAVSGGSAAITYRLDGKESKNQLVSTGPGSLMFTYLSRWEGDALVSTITWTTPTGTMQRKESIALEGDALVIRSIRLDPASGAESVVQTSVYAKKRK